MVEAELPLARVAVLCGGLATRLGPIAAHTPKFALPVAGRPFGAWLIERLVACGLPDVLLCVGHLAAPIEAFVGDGRALGARVRYAHDGPIPLGTGGAIRAALPRLAPNFLVTYGDSYLPFDYQAPLQALDDSPEALGAMAVHANHDRIEPSNAAIEAGRVVRYDKARDPNGSPALDHIDYGATAFRREAFASAPAGAGFPLDALQARLAADGALRAVVAAERFYEIGSPAGLRDLEARLARGQGPR